MADLTKKAMKAAPAAVVIDPDTNAAATIEMAVPGKQTIPRAELWAVICLAAKVPDGHKCKVYVDSQCTVNGLRNLDNGKTMKKLQKGDNGDLWRLMSNIRKEKGIELEVIKVKSHVEKVEDCLKYDMDEEKWKYNQLADDAAKREARKMIRPEAQQKQDAQTIEEAYLVALRAALVEAHCWRTKGPRKSSTTTARR